MEILYGVVVMVFGSLMMDYGDYIGNIPLKNKGILVTVIGALVFLYGLAKVTYIILL